MAKKTTKEEFNAIKKVIKDNPNLSNSELAKKAKCGTTLLSQVKNSSSYTVFTTKYSRSKNKNIACSKKEGRKLEEIIDEILADEEKPKEERKGFFAKLKSIFGR